LAGGTDIEIGGARLINPVICGSGEHVMTEAGLRSALDAGVGAVVAKSVNETQAARDQLERTDYALLDGSWNRLPWDFTAPRDATLACRSGLQTMDFAPWLDIVARLDRDAADSGQYVIASIILADLDAAIDMARQVEAAGVRILEFNIGTPGMHKVHQKEMMMMVDHGALEADRINHARMKMDMGGGKTMEHNDPNSALLEPGKSAEIVWKFSKAGTYEFACNVPGHYDAGMVGKLDVK